MSDRNQSITERVARAEKDLLEFKSAQIFGKDVTRPKVIERYNSDGTPTEWDVIGEYDSNVGWWKIGGLITYTSRTQKNPWATVSGVIQVNPGNEIVSFEGADFTAIRDMEDVFSGGQTIKFDTYGTAASFFGPPSDPSIDRYWLKIYVFATDYGDIKLDFPHGDNPAGTVVSLT